MNKGLIFIITALLLYNMAYSQSIKKINLNDKDFYSGHYLVVEPEKDSIAGVLILIAGFGQIPENIMPETKLQNVAYVNNILTISFAVGNKLYADFVTQANLTAVIRDIISKYKVNTNKFVIGGYSAGGMIALKYVELCNEFPDRFPIQPKGVFMVDSPIDIFTIYEQLEESAKNKYSELAVEEAERAISFIKNDFGVQR